LASFQKSVSKASAPSDETLAMPRSLSLLFCFCRLAEFVI
jgi:hypothetical protein